MVTHYTVDDLRVALGFAKPGSDEGARRRRAGTPRLNRTAARTGQAADGGHAPGSESDAPSNAPPSRGDP